MGAAIEAAIKVEGLSAGYDGRIVLEGVSLTIAPGERVGLVGPNGAGKTTLLRTLLGFHAVRGGCVRVLGLDPGVRVEAHRLRRQVGLVFQNADDQLFCPTVLDDVAFGPLNQGHDASEADRRAIEAMDFVGIEKVSQRVSHHLSAGEKRRVALAATLAMQPEVLLLDEPTGELDPRGRRRLIDLLGALAQTLLIATHDLGFVLETCTRVVVICGGGIAADGDPKTVLSDEELMTRCALEVPDVLRCSNQKTSF